MNHRSAEKKKRNIPKAYLEMGKEPMLWREISTEIETDGRTLVPREKKLRKSERRKSSRVLFEYVSSRHIGLFTLNNPYLRGQGRFLCF